MRAVDSPLKVYAASAPLDDEEAIMFLCALLPSPYPQSSQAARPRLWNRLGEERQAPMCLVSASAFERPNRP